MRQLVTKENVGLYGENGVRLIHQPNFMRVDTANVSNFVVTKKKFNRTKEQGHFQDEPGYAFTFHKVQGITAETGVIMDLNLPPPAVGKTLAQLDQCGIYVAFSRARSLSQMRVFPFNERGFAHLLRLCKRKHFPALFEARHLTPLTYQTKAEVKRARPPARPNNKK